jgi:hypothetical protein
VRLFLNDRDLDLSLHLGMQADDDNVLAQALDGMVEVDLPLVHGDALPGERFGDVLAVIEPKSRSPSPALPGRVTVSAFSRSAIAVASPFSALSLAFRALDSAAIRFLLPSVAS